MPWASLGCCQYLAGPTPRLPLQTEVCTHTHTHTREARLSLQEEPAATGKAVSSSKGWREAPGPRRELGALVASVLPPEARPGLPKPPFGSVEDPPIPAPAPGG